MKKFPNAIKIQPEKYLLLLSNFYVRRFVEIPSDSKAYIDPPSTDSVCTFFLGPCQRLPFSIL